MNVDTRKKIVFGIGGFIGLLGLILSIVAMANNTFGVSIFEFYKNTKGLGSLHSDLGMGSIGAIFALIISFASLVFSGYKGHLVWTNKNTSSNDEIIAVALVVLAFTLSVAAIACAEKWM